VPHSRRDRNPRLLPAEAGTTYSSSPVRGAATVFTLAASVFRDGGGAFTVAAGVFTVAGGAFIVAGSICTVVGDAFTVARTVCAFAPMGFAGTRMNFAAAWGYFVTAPTHVAAARIFFGDLRERASSCDEQVVRVDDRTLQARALPADAVPRERFAVGGGFAMLSGAIHRNLRSNRQLSVGIEVVADVIGRSTLDHFVKKGGPPGLPFGFPPIPSTALHAAVSIRSQRV
jgi:hypothetical protein